MTTRAERIGMRTFNDGRFLETELKLLGDGDGLTWGFALGIDRGRDPGHMQRLSKPDQNILLLL